MLLICGSRPVYMRYRVCLLRACWIHTDHADWVPGTRSILYNRLDTRVQLQYYPIQCSVSVGPRAATLAQHSTGVDTGHIQVNATYIV